MTPVMFLAVTFIIGALMSFFTGSSWGTFAICIPLAVPMAYSFTGGELGTLVYTAIGAVVVEAYLAIIVHQYQTQPYYHL